MVRKKATFGTLLDAQIARAAQHIPTRPTTSLDSTGWDAHYVSRYFLCRAKGRCKRHRPWIKSTFVCDNHTHLILAWVQGRGPSNDAAFFFRTIRQAAQRHALHCVLADAAYDAEPFHALCRNELGVRQTAIPINPRNAAPGHVPTTPYRREMARHFPRRLYRQRNHAECVVSQCKRRISPNLNARSSRARHWEAQLKALTFNTLLLADLLRK